MRRRAHLRPHASFTAPPPPPLTMHRWYDKPCVVPNARCRVRWDRGSTAQGAQERECGRRSGRYSRRRRSQEIYTVPSLAQAPESSPMRRRRSETRLTSKQTNKHLHPRNSTRRRVRPGYGRGLPTIARLGVDAGHPRPVGRDDGRAASGGRVGEWAVILC